MTSLLTHPAPSSVPSTHLRRSWAVPAIALAATLVWLPNLARPLSSDEGGFLLVASQWSPGTSLYGDYWVDRPPLLIGIFQLADLGGGLLALRIIGLLAVVASVLLAARIGRIAALGVRRAPVLVAATAAVFMTTPLFGASEVDGELLAVPFVLASVLCTLQALQRPNRWWWAGAGVAAMAAVLVKQSMADGFVLAAVVVVWLSTHRRGRDAVEAIAYVGLGAVVCLGVVLVWAATHGTGPIGLWQAVITFRAQAAAVISGEANSATPGRALTLSTSFLASGAIVIVLLGLLPGLSRRAGGPDVRLLAAAVLGWEVVGIAFGGSYWLHYLLGLVPGLVLAASVVAGSSAARVRWAAASLVYATTAAVVATVGLVVHDTDVPSDVAVARYLADHKAAGDTGVVGFGNPAILEAAGLGSPYPQLWSLPVRVLDPGLVEFTHVMGGPDAPTWAVVNGASLATWGVDTSRAQAVFDRDYHLVDVIGDYRVYHLR